MQPNARLLRLQSMGFEAEAARRALAQAGGNLEEAAALLVQGAAAWPTAVPQPDSHGATDPIPPPPPPPAATRSSDSILGNGSLIGRRVVLCALSVHAELNGRHGTVVGADGGRYMVDLGDGGRDSAEESIISVKEDNLIPAEALDSSESPGVDAGASGGGNGAAAATASGHNRIFSEAEQFRAAIAASLGDNSAASGSASSSDPTLPPSFDPMPAPSLYPRDDDQQTSSPRKKPPPPPPPPHPPAPQRQVSLERSESVLARQAVHEATAAAVLDQVTETNTHTRTHTHTNTDTHGHTYTDTHLHTQTEEQHGDTAAAVLDQVTEIEIDRHARTQAHTRTRTQTHIHRHTPTRTQTEEQHEATAAAVLDHMKDRDRQTRTHTHIDTDTDTHTPTHTDTHTDRRISIAWGYGGGGA